MKKLISLCLIVAMLTISTPVAIKAENNGLEEQLKFTPPVVDIANVGYGIQRTMRLLETSTSESNNTVRIAFCGQSITDANNNLWPAAVIAFLKDKYPNANIQSVNFGIGGYNTWLQQNIIQNDITSFYPDLTFFYDYGDMGIYASMIQFIRENTVSEVVIQNDHLDIANGEFGSDIKSFNTLPGIATQFNCELADIRTNWKKYLDANSLTAVSLLTDTVHLNKQGQALMYEILKQYFVYKPVDETTFDDRTTKYFIGKDVNWNGNKLTLPFRGNRIELISSNKLGADSCTASVKINSKKPSSYIELCNYTRYLNLTSHVFESYFMKIGFMETAKAETWELEFTSVNPNNKKDCDYKVTGSKTGYDGTGNTLKDFITKSGTLEFRSTYFYNLSTPTVGKKLVFETTINGSDTVTLKSIEKLASNLPDLNNSLELTMTSGTHPVTGYLMSYRPGFLFAAPKVNPIKLGDTQVSGSAIKLGKVEVNIGGCKYLGTVGRDGTFNVKVPIIKSGEIVSVIYRLEDYKSQLYRVKMDGIAATPTIKKIGVIDSNKKVITGRATNGSTVVAKIGKVEYKGISATTTGLFTIKIPMLKPGSSIIMSANANGVSSKTKSIKVKLGAPIINKISTKSNKISGKAYPKSRVTIKYSGKVKIVKSTSKGTFSFAINNSLKKGQVVSVAVKYAGLVSVITKIRV